jgi:Methyltransferase domain
MKLRRRIERSGKAILAPYPALYNLAKTIFPRHIDEPDFTQSSDYWKQRYLNGLDSGDGSYGPLAQYKARFVNQFVHSRGIKTALELGCGDGNQQSMFNIEHYTGVDISDECIVACNKKYKSSSRSFYNAQNFHSLHSSEQYDLTLSLDVVYHLIEDQVFEKYIHDLFSRSKEYVLIYSSDENHYDSRIPHVKHRKFTEQTQTACSQFKLISVEINPFEKSKGSALYGSFAKFHIYEKQ